MLYEYGFGATLLTFRQLHKMPMQPFLKRFSIVTIVSAIVASLPPVKSLFSDDD